MKSTLSLNRERKRNSPETLEFKRKVNEFLRDANPEIAYSIKRDLAVMTSMPFYKDRPPRLKIQKKPIEILFDYIEFFNSHDDKDFIAQLIKKLGTNQGQILRKAAPRIGKKNEIWEHAIPVKILTEELIKMIKLNDLSDLNKLLNIYQIAGQRGLSKKDDDLLEIYRSSMPIGWDWRLEDCNPLARYLEVGIIIIE